MDILAYLAGTEDLPEPDMTIKEDEDAWNWLTDRAMTVAKIYGDDRQIKVPVDNDAWVVCGVGIRDCGALFGSRYAETKVTLLYDAKTDRYNEFRCSSFSARLYARRANAWDCGCLEEPVAQAAMKTAFADGPCRDVPAEERLSWYDRESRERIFDIVRAKDPQNVVQEYFREHANAMVREALSGWALATPKDILEAMREPEKFTARVAVEIEERNAEDILALRQGAAMLLASAEEIKAKADHPWHQWGDVVNALETVEGVNVRVQYEGHELKVERGRLISACRSDMYGYMDVYAGHERIRVTIRDIEKISYGRKVLYEQAA